MLAIGGQPAPAELQAAKEIIAEAANRSLDDPVVAIYHQAESVATLRAFLANDALKAKMQEAGVIAAPDVQFVIGGWTQAMPLSCDAPDLAGRPGLPAACGCRSWDFD